MEVILWPVLISRGLFCRLVVEEYVLLLRAGMDKLVCRKLKHCGVSVRLEDPSTFFENLNSVDLFMAEELICDLVKSGRGSGWGSYGDD